MEWQGEWEGPVRKLTAARKRYRRDFASTLRSITGKLPHLQKLVLKRVFKQRDYRLFEQGGFKIYFHDTAPIYTEKGETDALNSAVRELAQPTVRCLELVNWVVSPDLFVNTQNETPNDPADRWRELRQFVIRADTVGPDADWYLKGGKNGEDDDEDADPNDNENDDANDNEGGNVEDEDSDDDINDLLIIMPPLPELNNEIRGSWRKEVDPEAVTPLFDALTDALRLRMPCFERGCLSFRDILHETQAFHLCLIGAGQVYPCRLCYEGSGIEYPAICNKWSMGQGTGTEWPVECQPTEKLEDWRWDGWRRCHKPETQSFRHAWRERGKLPQS